MNKKNRTEFIKKNFYFAFFVIGLMFAISLAIAAYDATKASHSTLYANTIEPKTPGQPVNILGGLSIDSVPINTLITSLVGGLGSWTESSGNISRLTGNVGIGTTDPRVRLHVAEGHQYITSTTNYTSLWFGTTYTNPTTNWAGIGMKSDGSLRLTGGGSLDDPHLTIGDNSNIGIGKNPSGWKVDIQAIKNTVDNRQLAIIARRSDDVSKSMFFVDTDTSKNARLYLYDSAESAKVKLLTSGTSEVPDLKVTGTFKGMFDCRTEDGGTGGAPRQATCNSDEFPLSGFCSGTYDHISGINYQLGGSVTCSDDVAGNLVHPNALCCKGK